MKLYLNPFINLFIIFLILKLTHCIDWHWAIIWSPIILDRVVNIMIQIYESLTKKEGRTTR